MKFRYEINKFVVSAAIVTWLFSVISGLTASAVQGEIANSSALTHAVLAENATATW